MSHHEQLRRDSIEHHSAKIDRMLGRAHGGVVHNDKRQDEKMIKKALSEHDEQLHPGKHTKLKFADGGAVARGARHDRRARGGAAKHKGTHVAVIVAPQGGGADRGAPPGALPTAGPMAAPPPRPPMPPPGGGMPGAPGGMAGGPPIGAMAGPRPPMPGMPPGGGAPMPMHARGGMVGRARGGRAQGGATEENQMNQPGSAVQPKIEGDLNKPLPGKWGGGRVAKRARGGAAEGKEEKEEGRSAEWASEEAHKADAKNPHRLNKIVTMTKRADGGKVGPLEDKEPDGEVEMDAGAGGGEGRLEKMKRYGKNSDDGEDE